MAAFENAPETWQREDWALLQNGFVSLFWSKELFENAKHELADDGYSVITFDAESWGSERGMLAAFAATLNFPDYFGQNLNALVDCLRDVADFSYGSNSDATGTVIAVSRLDTYAASEPGGAQILLDILSGTGRLALLIGHRFIVIAQSDDPAIEFEPVGATPVMWNRREWLNSERGL